MRDWVSVGGDGALTDAKAIKVATMIAERADRIAADVLREIELRCDGRPEFTAIMLHAVERRIMEMRHVAQRKAAGI